MQRERKYGIEECVAVESVWNDYLGVSRATVPLWALCGASFVGRDGLMSAEQQFWFKVGRQQEEIAYSIGAFIAWAHDKAYFPQRFIWRTFDNRKARRARAKRERMK